MKYKDTLKPRHANDILAPRGGSRIFFRRGCTRLLLYFNTNKPHSFFCRIPVVLENRRSSKRGGGAHPLHSPPRSAPGTPFAGQASKYPFTSFTSVDLITGNVVAKDS